MYAAEAIILSENMKKALETATKEFEAKLILLTEESVEKANINPVTVTYHVPSNCGKTVDVSWDLYITYPFILWDPLTHYKTYIYNLLFMFDKRFNARNPSPFRQMV